MNSVVSCHMPKSLGDKGFPGFERASVVCLRPASLIVPTADMLTHSLVTPFLVSMDRSCVSAVSHVSLSALCSTTAVRGGGPVAAKENQVLPVRGARYYGNLKRTAAVAPLPHLHSTLRTEAELLTIS